MTKKAYDGALLLGILLILSVSIGVLHGYKKPIHIVIGELRLEKQDALDYISPYLLAGNVNGAANILHRFSDDTFLAVLQEIFGGQTNLLNDIQKVHLLLELIVQDRLGRRRNIAITELANRFAEYPVLYEAMVFHARAVNPIQEWIKSTESNHIYNSWLQKSLDKAVDQNNWHFFASLFLYGIKPTEQQVSDILRKVVREARDVRFVPILVQKLGADANYSFDKKRTILIEAVENNDIDMVRALLQVGADQNIVLDATIGNAQQIAFERGYTAIDLLLREARISEKPEIPSNTKVVNEK